MDVYRGYLAWAKKFTEVATTCKKESLAASRRENVRTAYRRWAEEYIEVVFFVCYDASSVEKLQRRKQ